MDMMVVSTFKHIST